MRDIPVLLLAATVWAYWLYVGWMVVRMRRRTRRLSGVVPQQGLERLMWLVWVPLIAAWMALPYLAAVHPERALGVPDFAASGWPLAARWAAAACALACLALSIRSWRQMGRNWRMAVTPDEPTDLVTEGPFARVRHPIYALSMLLMLCSLAILPNLPMLAIAAVHIVLMNLKARNEERFMLGAHGERYAQYVQRTGRFLPRWS